ncbi:MAG: hypothetical protein WC839_01520 [Candidatus Paceibacterota bacterium]
MNTTTIISGVSGEIGQAFKVYFENKGHTVYGFSSRFTEGLEQLDFLDNEAVKRFFENHKNQISEAEVINFLHLIGPFKTEMDLLTGEQVIENPREDNNLDDGIYRSTVETFENGVEGIRDIKKDNQKLVLSVVGSISDKYNIKYFQSSRESKNLIRRNIEKLTKEQKNIFGRIINVSSIYSKKEFQERPFTSEKDLEVWLRMEQILLVIENENYFDSSGDFYREIDVFNKKEGFTPSEYYTNSNIYRTRVIQRTGKTPEEFRKMFKEFSDEQKNEQNAEVNEIKTIPYHTKFGNEMKLK